MAGSRSGFRISQPKLNAKFANCLVPKRGGWCEEVLQAILDMPPSTTKNDILNAFSQGNIAGQFRKYKIGKGLLTP
jgi:phage terminase large subunit-like protein